MIATKLVYRGGRMNSARMSGRWCFLTVASGLCWLVAGLPGAQAVAQTTDTIIRKDGPSVRGTVTGSFKQGLRVDSQGATHDIGSHEIKHVMLAGEPSELRQAKQALSSGDSAQAARALERVEPAEIERELVREELEFVRAATASQMAIQTGAGLDEAARQMLDFLKNHPNSFHFYDAAESLGHLSLALGRFDTASKSFEQLEKAPWPETQFRGSVLLTEVLRAQGPEHLQAVLERYDRIVESDVEGPELERQKQVAILGRAGVRAELGETEGSVEGIEALIDRIDVSDAELMGLAYNALGACYRAQQQITDAVLAYLHVDLLFASNAEAHAEALYYLSQLWGELGKPDRGVDASNRLKANYPGSRWANR